MWLVGTVKKVLASVDIILLLLFTQQAGYEFGGNLIYVQIVFEIAQNCPKCNPNMLATSSIMILHISMFCSLTDILQQVTLLWSWKSAENVCSSN